MKWVCILRGGEDVVRRNTPDIRISEYRARPCSAACKPSARSWLYAKGARRRSLSPSWNAKGGEGLKDIADPEHFEFNINWPPKAA